MSEKEGKYTSDISVKQIEYLEMPITKLVDTIFGQGDMGQPDEISKMAEAGFDIDVTGKSKTKVFIKKVGLLFVNNDNIDKNGIWDENTPKRLTAYDRIVFDSYCTLADQGCQCITARKILHIMTGSGKNNKQDSVAIKKIETSIRKMRLAFVSFDWTEQRIQYELNEIERSQCRIIEEPVIPASIIQHRQNNGSYAMAFVPRGLPILFIYSKALGQIASVHLDMLNIEVTNTERSMVIQSYLDRRIEKMKNIKSKRRIKPEEKIIRIDTLYRSCQIDGDRKMLFKVRKTVFKILDCYIQNGYIRNYEKVMIGKTVEKVIIDLPKNKT